MSALKRSIISGNAPYLILTLFFTGIGLFSLWTPKLQEDLEFMVSNHDFINGLSDTPDFKGIWNDIVFHYKNTNGRLGDKLVIPLLCLLPESILAALNAIMASGIIAGIWKLLRPFANTPMRKWLQAAAVPLILVSFPWHEDMFLMSYSANYIWSAAIAVWAVYCFCNNDFLAKLSAPVYVVLCVALIIAGAWHECITLTIAPGLCAYALLDSASTRKRRFTLMACMCIGLSTLLIAGGQQERVAHSTFSFNPDNILLFRHGIPLPKSPAIPLIIYLCLLAISILKVTQGHTVTQAHHLLHAIRQSRLALLQTVCLSAAMTGMMLFATFGVQRSLSVGIVFTSTGILTVTAYILRHLPDRSLTILIIKTIIAMTTVIALTNLMLNLCVQHKMYESFMEIRQKWAKSESGIVFHNLPDIGNAHSYPWQMIITDMYVEGWKQYYLAHYLEPLQAPKQLIVIPQELRTISNSNKRVLNAEAGVYAIGEHLIYTNPQNRDLALHSEDTTTYRVFSLLTFDAVFKHGEKKKIFAYVLPFTSEEKTPPCHYIYPLYSNHKPNISQMVSVENVVLINRDPIKITNTLR